MPIVRGISTLLVSFIISIAILSIFIYIFINMVASMYSGFLHFRNVVRYSQLHEVSQLVVDRTIDRVYIFNLGPSDIAIDQVIVIDQASRIEAKKVFELCNSSLIPVYTVAACDPGYEYIAVVTLDGAVIYPRTPVKRIYQLRANATYIIPIIFSIKNPEDLRTEFDVDLRLIAKPYTNADIRFRGIKSEKLILLPPGQESEFYNARVSTGSSGLAFGVVVIGYDPSWIIEKTANQNSDTPPRFTVLIAGPGFTGTEKITINRREYTLSGNGFRILINNFSGVIQIKHRDSVIACSSSIPNQCSGVPLPAIGPWYYGTTDSNLNLRIYLNGTASYLARFMRMASGNSPTGETSYYPYLFIGDFDGNGINDVIFVTEDAYYGGSSSINDRYGNDDLSDWSTTPLILRLPQVGKSLGSPDGSIDGKTFAGIALYINIFFHDNSHPDENQLEDIDKTDWLLRILLVDEDGNEYIVREYRYQEICNYHKTYITDFGKDNYFVKLSQSIYVPIPSSEGRYWVAIAFQDPYATGPRNDADITVGVEFIGAIPFLR